MAKAFFITLAFQLAIGNAPSFGDERLLDEVPFDEVVFEGENQGGIHKVFPLQLPGRPALTSRPTGPIKIRFLDRPGQTFEVPASSIARVRFYEQMLLDEAVKLTGEGKFDEAFDYYARLLNDHPQTPGLEDQVGNYLHKNAVSDFQAGRQDRALAVLASLYERNPEYRGLAGAVETVAGSMIRKRLTEQDFAGARAALDLWYSRFPKISSRQVTAWRRRFQQAAARHVREAENLFQNKQYTAAQRAVRRATTIWPQVEGAEELIRQIQQEHPQVIVGVFETAPATVSWRLDNWSARRVRALVQRNLCELQAYTPEGGLYRSPYGALSIDESGRRLTLQMPTQLNFRPGQPAHSAAHGLARFLLAMADPTSPHYRGTFAAVCDAVTVDNLGHVHVDLARPHVRPEAILQLALPADRRELNSRVGVKAPFQMAEWDERLVRFESQPNDAGTSPELRAVVERTMTSDHEALTALLRGEVSVLDHVPPWQVSQLKTTDGIRVGEYLLPTVHVLIPHQSHPLLRRREYRRALCFGINRKQILQQIIAAGVQAAGFEVLSGPFPTGRSQSDPLRYAYNNQVSPRDYEPSLAATLSLVAATSVAKARKGDTQKGETPPVAKPDKQDNTADKQDLHAPVVLAHASDALARTACEAIARQLNQAGISVKLRELSTDQLLDGTAEFDLRYAQLNMWEPLVDAHLLLGADGLVGTSSPAMRAALRALEDASNWNQVREHLNEIHRIAYNDLPVIPLWQTVNFFAYRAELTGIGELPVTLYQNIDQWRLQ